VAWTSKKLEWKIKSFEYDFGFEALQSLLLSRVNLRLRPRSHWGSFQRSRTVVPRFQGTVSRWEREYNAFVVAIMFHGEIKIKIKIGWNERREKKDGKRGT